MMPWNDRLGKFSPLKALVLAGLFIPALMLLLSAWQGSLATPGTAGPLGPRPVTEAIHRTGDWAIRFLVMSLAVTPLRRIGNWPKLILARRMIGLAALCYAFSHFLLYITDQKFDLARVASEIALRFYLTVGFVALVGLSVLGATSTDAAVRRLGRNWVRLHKAVYVIAVLAALHFFIQTKADVFQATLLTGLFVLLMLYRVMHWRGLALTSPFVLVGAAVAAAVLTAGIEYAWYGLATGVPPGRVLAANLQFSFSIRPAWWVLAVGIVAALVALARHGLGRKETARRGRRPAA